MRLIDADALFDDLIFPSKQFERGLRELIGEAPTIDAVPVVRCWECYRWEAYDGYNGDRGLGWCDEGHGDTTHALFFCACGKRKDGDGDG